MTIARVRQTALALSLVVFPLSILAYWLLYPAYGLLDSVAVLRAIDGHAARTATADVFAFSGAFLAAPATLALMRVLNARSPRLATIGGAMHLLGWIAIVGLVMGDVIAVQMVAGGTPAPDVVQLFRRIMSSAPVIALNIIATLHVIGGTMLGIALWRTRVVPLWAGVAATLAQPIHFVSNIAGILWIDAMTWIALAASLGSVAAVILRPDAAVERAQDDRRDEMALSATT
ncbi:MAG TPA: hypothetical protein VGQ56_07960 [Gemmatimonadaceae bacterium]|nr:hypothetical protein [Gemmatimonadaceae bacterium]